MGLIRARMKFHKYNFQDTKYIVLHLQTVSYSSIYNKYAIKTYSTEQK